MFPSAITKGSKGAWTILPYIEDLTPDQKKNFNAVAVIPEEVYQSVLYKADTAKQEADIRRFGTKYGFDVTRVGITNLIVGFTQTPQNALMFQLS